MSNLIGLSDILQEEPGNLDFIKMLRMSSIQLDKTIGNLNNLLKFENESATLERIPCNVSESIEKVLALNNKIILDEKIQVEVSIPKDILVKAVPVYLDSIFHNVIVNAIKYGTTENAKVIEISLEENKENVLIYEKDFGVGIDLSKYLDKLFEPGTRMNNKSDGQGLGLFMAKNHIESLGGCINVESNVGSGTTFKMSFRKD